MERLAHPTAALAPSPHLSATVEGDQLVLENRALQVQVRVTGPVAVLLPWLQAIDGRASVGVITWQVHQGRLDAATMRDALALFERLYQADIIELRSGAARG